MKNKILITDSMTSDSNSITLSAQDAVLGGAGFSDLNITVNSDLTYASGTWSFKGKTVRVNGDLHQQDGIINLGKGQLIVTGDYYQKSGTLNPSGGTIQITGSYYNAVPTLDDAGDPVYNTSSGILYMTNEASAMKVGKDFIMASTQSHTDKLTAGYISIKGDFEQIAGSAYNFAASGTHKVLLNGASKQYITFASTSSKFNKLQLTKDPDTGYVFNPNPCWNELDETISELTILTQPVDYAGIVGTNAEFTVEAAGNGLTYQWQSCDADSEIWENASYTGNQTDSLTVPIEAERDGMRFRCIIADADGNQLISDEAVLNVKYSLSIIEQIGRAHV